MSGLPISLDRAVEITRTGDIWVFRGRSLADRAIRGVTNSPVNHVGMTIAIEDLPPLMWHAELGRSLPDLWSGRHQRGVQLHDLRDAVRTWHDRYGQRGWLRQLDGEIGREREDAALRTVARLDGTPFPSTARLASRWLRGRAPRAQDALTAAQEALHRGGGALHDGGSGLLARVRRLLPGAPEDALDGTPPAGGPAAEGTAAVDIAAVDTAAVDTAAVDTAAVDTDGGLAGLETAYCAEVVAVTYEEMGLLAADRRPNWYDPGRFWSGDDLPLAPGFRLGGEIAVTVPPSGASARS